MARLKASNGYALTIGENVDYSHFFYGSPIAASKSLYALSYGGGNVEEFRGKNFHYDKDGIPDGGIVKSQALFLNGERVMVADGLNIKVSVIVKAAETFKTSDDKKVIEKMLSGDDTITGADQQDVLLGYNGDDKLYGGQNWDGLSGGKGNDLICGGGGLDYLWGDGGKDTFLFRSVSDSKNGTGDLIWDFSQKERDRIDIKGIDANELRAGNQAFEFTGEGELSGRAGELAYTFKGGYTYIRGDVDGDGEADLLIGLKQKVDLDASDFIL